MPGKDVKEPARKLEWRTPKLEQVGNLRDFVRTGGAHGKTGSVSDGSSSPGGEKHVPDH